MVKKWEIHQFKILASRIIPHNATDWFPILILCATVLTIITITFQYIPKDYKDPLLVFQILITIIGIIITYIFKLYCFRRALVEINLTIDTITDNFVRFSIEIVNKGDITITSKTVNLYLCNGVLESNNDYTRYRFPFLLKHAEKNCHDCLVKKMCDKNNFQFPQDQITSQGLRDITGTNILLESFSDKAILYIEPGEKYSEDIILRLKKDFYQATIIAIFDPEYCICKSKQFYIE